MPKHPKQRYIALAVLALSLTACMVGPDFHQPDPPSTKNFTEQPLPKKTAAVPGLGSAGQAQYFLLNEDISSQWWTLFRSPALNQLIRRGIANSPNLKAAQAVLRQAQENLNAQIGSSFFPAISAGPISASKEKFATSTIGESAFTNDVFSLYNVSVNVSYTFDVFGGLRRQTEAVAAQVDFQRFELEATYIALTANIVTTAITAAALQEQIYATQELIRSQEKQLGIVLQQYRLGSVSQADVLAQRTELAQTRALLPGLQKNLAQTRDALSVLVGAVPSESKLPKINLASLHLPAKLPVSLPSTLVQHRPDVRASEALLHAASAQVGVATANMFPNIILTGGSGTGASYQFSSNQLQKLFSPASTAWGVGVQLTQPIFNGGALRAQKRAAVAAYDQAMASYRQTVLQAFQNVADTLHALEIDAQLLRSNMQAEIAARNTLRINEKQFQLGGISYLSLLNAQRQYQQTRISRIQAEALRYNDTAALFQALGGGWWNKN